MAIADSNGLPIAISTHEASTHEVKLVEKTISKWAPPDFIKFNTGKGSM
jgi:hypothetical protein